MPVEKLERVWGWFLDSVEHPSGKQAYVLMRPDISFWRYGIWMHFPLPSELIPTPANEP